MKRLYNCKAYVDESGLISCEKRIVTIYYKNNEICKIVYNNIRTTTTLLHVRLYIKFLRENINLQLATFMQGVYDIAGKHKDLKVLVFGD